MVSLLSPVEVAQIVPGELSLIFESGDIHRGEGGIRTYAAVEKRSASLQPFRHPVPSGENLGHQPPLACTRGRATVGKPTFASTPSKVGASNHIALPVTDTRRLRARSAAGAKAGLACLRT